ncbi:HDOD domain-containing protein [Kamptonema cortianum]|nr:HDOD domain-containing protein [Geitlerinema splendidum]MDK3155852.1 HDOD domain-containing protein [Kamptonema cortianum]
MKRILFVDDEKFVLEAICNLLRRHRTEWIMDAALSGQEALEKLKKADYDIVCSDMRMPGMDGATFLKEVQAKYPDTVRLVLTGQASREHILRTVPYAHQFLSKPCDQNTLESTLTRFMRLRDDRRVGNLREFILGIGSLPTSSAAYQSIIEVLEQPDVSVSSVKRAIERDPCISAKVLQFANSAFVSPGRPITDLGESIALLGFEFIRLVVITNEVLEANGPLKEVSSLLQREQKQAFQKAQFAKAIAHGSVSAHDAFSVGAFSSVGRVLIALAAKNLLPSEDPLTLADESADNQVKALTAAYDGLGGFLLAAWGLPVNVVEAVTFQNEPEHVLGDNPLVRIAHVTECCAKVLNARAPSIEASLLPAVLAQSQANGELEQWYQIAAETFDSHHFVKRAKSA